jgi:hypothetical protein
MRFLAQMVRLPMAALAYGMDVLVKTVQDSQRGANQPGEALSAAKANGNLPSVYKEMNEMPDQELSADELKVVRYRIVFKKRDLEVTLYANEELVSYDTDGASFGALKIAEYMGRVSEGRVNPPRKFVEEGYAGAREGNRKWRIPEQDQRYIGFLFEVIRRAPREEKEYDRAQVKELKRIADEIKHHHRGE